MGSFLDLRLHLTQPVMHLHQVVEFGVMDIFGQASDFLIELIIPLGKLLVALYVCNHLLSMFVQSTTASTVGGWW